MNLLEISTIVLLIAYNHPRPVFTQGRLNYPPYGYFSSEDVTRIAWAHAVNSQKELSATLSDPSIRMIEADLCRGRLNSSGEIGYFDIAVMAHPPTRISDLSFVSFIDQVIAYNKGRRPEDMKGVKLDFKDYFAAVRAVNAMRSRNATAAAPLTFPVWLNADVVRGPVNSSSEPKINGVDLLKLHDLNLPNAVLSLGWTTRYGPQSDGQNITDGIYTRDQVDEMIQVFKNFSGNVDKVQNIPVTFAVRAAIAEKSLPTMLYLLNGTSSRSSLTFWSGANDPPSNLALWDDFLKVVGRDRVFIDVPFEWDKSAANGNYRAFIYLIPLSLIFALKDFFF